MYEKKKTVLILILFSVLLLTGCSRKIFIRTYCDSVINNNIKPLKYYASKKNNSVYASIADSVISIKRDINYINSYLMSFQKKKSFDENDLERLIILVEMNKSLKIRIFNVVTNIHRLDKNEIPTYFTYNSAQNNKEKESFSLRDYKLQEYFSAPTYYKQEEEFFGLNDYKLHEYCSALEYCVDNSNSQIKSIIKITSAQNAFEEYINHPSDSLYKTIRINFTNDIKCYKKYSNGLQSKKGDATSFIYSYFLEKSDSALIESSYYDAKLQIVNGDIYSGICNLQSVSQINNSSDIRQEVKSLIEKLDSESKLSVYLSTIKFENIYTKEPLQEVFIKIYTLGDEKPIILKVKVNLTNYSNKTVSILEHAPLFSFIKAGLSDKGNEKIEKVYLFPNSTLKSEHNKNLHIFPGKSSERTFFYFINLNYCSGTSTWDLYKYLFNRINFNINFNLFTNAYNEGKASMYLKIGNQNYPIDNLIKIK